MPNTSVRSRQIFDGDIVRADINTTTTGSALITKLIAGSGLSISTSTGVDSGTGDVTLTLSTSGVTASTYGSTTQIPVITVDSFGRITAVTTASPTTTWGGVFGGSFETTSTSFSLDANSSVQYIYTGSSAASWTVPDMSTGGWGNRAVYIKNRGTGTITLSRSGTNLFFDTSSTATSITVAANEAVLLMSGPSSIWNVYRHGGSGGSGTVTSVSVVSANGFAGTVATSTTTPAITLTTTITGLLKGNGTAISAAAAGTDYLAPFGSQTANTVYAAPNGSAGSPTFRALVAADIPALTLENLPDAWIKRSVRAATTANITLSGTQTIDGVALVAGDRVLVKNQTAAQDNGIYIVSATAWSRATDANLISEIAGGMVNVESGTVNGGKIFDTDIKLTDTLGTTAMNWNMVVDTTGGTTNYLTKFSSISAISNSLVFDTGTAVLVNTTTSTGATFEVNGTTRISGATTLANLAGTGLRNVLADTNGLLSAVAATSVFPILLDGGGAAITTGIKGDFVVPFNCTVTGWTILSTISGSIVVDIWQDTYANFPPTVADTITGANKPTLSSAVRNQATGLSWSLTAGSILRINVDSASTVQLVSVNLQVTRT